MDALGRALNETVGVRWIHRLRSRESGRQFHAESLAVPGGSTGIMRIERA